MKVLKTIEEIRGFLAKLTIHEEQIGLVPTMGALHEGHLTLVKKSVESSEITIVSLFVNPAQFNNKNDLINYPDTLNSDLEKLKAHGVDVVFLPNAKEMYPVEPNVSFSFGDISTFMEGEFRPGHFSGVALVVSKLFNIIRPGAAYFGQKDLQQLAVIRILVEQLNYGIRIVGVPTVREPDGLAMSSRNSRLSPLERQLAPVFYKSLKALEQKLIENSSVEIGRREVIEEIQKTAEVQLEYLEVVDSSNLKKVQEIEDHSQISLCIAGFIGDVRLLDNIYFDKNAS